MSTLLLAGAGAVTGAYSGYQQKKEAERNAELTLENTEQQAIMIERGAETLKQTQKSRFLASGIDLSGSPLLLLKDTLARGKEQANRVRESGANQAKALKRSGRNAFISSILQGTSAGLQAGGGR